MRGSTTLLLLAVCTLPGCSLTAMLWADESRTPPLLRNNAVCRVHKVEGDFLSATSARPQFGTQTVGTGRGAVEVRFSVRRERHTSTEVMDFTPQQPGHLQLSPPDTEENWFALPGASLFEPRLWEFQVFRGNYFQDRTASVPLTFVGKLAPDRLGTLYTTDQAPPTWRALPPLPHGAHADHLLAAGARAFAQRDWVRLLTGAHAFTERDATTLAWLDDQGRVLTPAEMQRRLEQARLRSAAAEELSGYTMLGRLAGTWGDPLYVRVPLPVLVQGRALELKRVGDTVVWKRSQVWTGRLQPGTGLPVKDPSAEPVASDLVDASELQSRPAQSIPLIGSQFTYTYAEENRDRSILGTLFKVLLTPPAAILDFVGRTSVAYVDILRWMASGNNRAYQGPIGPDKK